MAALKKQHSGDVKFLSSNDIISSWFFSKNPHSFMTINLRDRLENHTNDLAGNYESLVYYRTPEDTRKPELIRQSLSTFHRGSFESSPCRPSKFLSSNLSVLTNWSSFMIPNVDLDGAVLRQHIPAVDMTDFLPSTLSGCIIFQYSADQLAVVMGATQEVLHSLGQAPFEGESLD